MEVYVILQEQGTEYGYGFAVECPCWSVLARRSSHSSKDCKWMRINLQLLELISLQILMHAAVIIALLFISKSYDTSSTDDICSAPKFGSPEREKLIDEIHEFMLSKAPPVPQGSQGSKVQATIEENEIEGVEEELQNLVVEDGIVAEEPNETPSNAIVVQNSQPIAAMSTTELK